MPAITTRSGRTGHWIKMRRSPVGFSRPEALNRSLSLVDFIIITFESRFSVHTRRNIRIDTRWAAFDAESRQRFAKELITLGPGADHGRMARIAEAWDRSTAPGATSRSTISSASVRLQRLRLAC